MIRFLLLVSLATGFTLGIFLFIKRRPSWRYRGALLIFLSWLYFTIVFLIASLTAKDF